EALPRNAQLRGFVVCERTRDAVVIRGLGQATAFLQEVEVAERRERRRREHRGEACIPQAFFERGSGDYGADGQHDVHVPSVLEERKPSCMWRAALLVRLREVVAARNGALRAHVRTAEQGEPRFGLLAIEFLAVHYHA